MSLTKIFPWLAAPPLAQTELQQTESPVSTPASAAEAVHVEHLFYACEMLLDMAIFRLQHQASSGSGGDQVAQASMAREAIQGARLGKEPA